MPVSTELRAIYLKTSFLGWPKPNWDAHPGNRILGDSERDYLERMNNIFRRNVNHYRAVSAIRFLHKRGMDFVQARRGIVLCSRVGVIEPKDIGGAYQVHVLFSKKAVLARISNIPGELLGHNPNDRRFSVFRHFVLCL